MEICGHGEGASIWRFSAGAHQAEVRLPMVKERRGRLLAAIGDCDFPAGQFGDEFGFRSTSSISISYSVAFSGRRIDTAAVCWFIQCYLRLTRFTMALRI